MIELMIFAMVVAGIAGLVLMPLALMEILRLGRLNRQLAERNAVQAQGLATLAARGHRVVQIIGEDDLAALYEADPQTAAHSQAGLVVDGKWRP